MEQILAFVLGVGAVAFVWVVVVAFKTASKVKKQEKELTEMMNWILRNDELVNRRIDEEIDRVNRLHTNSIGYADSRVDKLESKLITTPKEILKG